MNKFQEITPQIRDFEAVNQPFDADFDENEPVSRQFAWNRVMEAQKRLEPAQISLQLTSF